MCDCYSHKCAGCNNTIEMHIADFCTTRDNLIIYCHKCVQAGKWKRYELKTHDHLLNNPELHKIMVMRGQKCTQAFVDIIEAPYQVVDVNGEPVGEPGFAILILCSDPDAYGVHLN